MHGGGPAAGVAALSEWLPEGIKGLDLPPAKLAALVLPSKMQNYVKGLMKNMPVKDLIGTTPIPDCVTYLTLTVTCPYRDPPYRDVPHRYAARPHSGEGAGGGGGMAATWQVSCALTRTRRRPFCK